MELTRKPTITLALTGKIGNGKSACGNSILGRNEFKTNDNVQASTLMTKIGWAKRDIMKVKVVDTPGLMDPDPSQELENINVQLHEVMSVCPEGIHALCLVLKYGNRFTDEEKKSVKKIKEIFGENFIRKHGIIIMTGGDTFDLNREDGAEDSSTFEQWCERQKGEFQEIIKECNNRIVLFYNRGRQYETEKERAVAQLLNLADEIGRNGLYTSDKFKLCFRTREEEILKLKLPELSVPIQKKLDGIAQVISEMLKNNTAKEDDLCILKKANEALLKIIDTIEDPEVKSKLCKKIDLLHVKISRINLQEPLKDQLEPISKIVTELKNPPMSAKAIATLVAIGITISGVLTGGAGLAIGVVAVAAVGGVTTAVGTTGTLALLIDKIVRMIESKWKSSAKAGHKD